MNISLGFSFDGIFYLYFAMSNAEKFLLFKIFTQESLTPELNLATTLRHNSTVEKLFLKDIIVFVISYVFLVSETNI